MIRKNKTNGSQGKIFKKTQRIVVALISITTFVTAFAVFAIEFSQGNDRIMSNYQQHTKTIAEFTEKVVDYVGSDRMQKPEDMENPDYKYVQEQLDIIRKVSDLQFLYIVRRLDNGSFIYLIDGQEPDSKDFANLGDPVHDVLLPPLKQVYETGEAVHDQSILQTDYGTVYSSYWPLTDENGDVDGAVGMTFNAGSMNYFDWEEARTGLLIAALIAAIFSTVSMLVSKKLFEPLYRRLAYTDALTGLDNRTAFELEMKRLQYETKEDVAVCIIVFDLNNLKRANDKYGHIMGDEYIRDAAHIIQRRFEDVGGCYRIGGDEFSVLSVGTQPEVVKHMLQVEFLADMREFQKALPEYKLNCFSIAYGMEVYDREKHGNIHDTFEAADNKMYAMKKEMKEKHGDAARSEGDEAATIALSTAPQEEQPGADL